MATATGAIAGVGVGAGGIKRVSLNPATFTVGGKLDDVDVTVLDARFCLYDYQGKSDSGPALCLGLQLQTDDGKTHEEYLSAGDKDYFRPSLPHEDGIASAGQDDPGGGGILIPTKERAAMSASTNASIFLNSLIAAGYPVAVLDQQTIKGALTGLKFHAVQMAQPKRAGIKRVARPGQQQQEEREKTVMTVARILVFPPVTGIASPPQPQPQPQAAAAVPNAAIPAQAPVSVAPAVPNLTPAPTPANGAAPDAAIDALCAETLYTVLAENNGAVAKAMLPGLAFKKLMANPMKARAIPRIIEESFLMSVPGVQYDGATVKM